jgi:hypothetical protein
LGEHLLWRSAGASHRHLTDRRYLPLVEYFERWELVLLDLPVWHLA